MIRIDREPPVQHIPRSTDLVGYYPNRRTVLGPLQIEVKPPKTVIKKITPSGKIE